MWPKLQNKVIYSGEIDIPASLAEGLLSSRCMNEVIAVDEVPENNEQSKLNKRISVNKKARKGFEMPAGERRDLNLFYNTVT